MKRILFLCILICLAVSGYGQRKIKKVEVKETGFNVTLKYNPVINEIVHENLKIKIIPVSPDDLNAEFLTEKTFNGKLNYTYYDNSRVSYFLKKKKRYTEKSDLEFFQEGALWLLENEIISQEEYDELERQMFNYFNQDAINEITRFDAIAFSNPYRIEEKFLSVFKMEISNPTNTFKVLSGDILVESGSKLQKQLSEDEIIQFLSYDKLLNSSKIESLKRHNLSLPISIPPNATFEKYFAVFPIDYRNNILAASLSGSDAKFKWDITKLEHKIEDTYTFYEINLIYLYNKEPSSEGTFFNLLNSTEPIIFLTNNLLYIDEKHVLDKFEVFCLSLKADKLYYGRIPFTGSMLIDVDKNRRSTLGIALTRIEELKKKVKL